MKMNKRDRYLIIDKGIARWKIDTPLENWLSYKADNSEFWKRIYVQYYKLLDKEYYKRGLSLIDDKLGIYKKEWQGLVKKNYIIRDMIYSLHRFGADFQDYWSYGFLNLSAIGKEQFVVDKLRYGYDNILTTPSIVDLVSDKYACYKKFKAYYMREAVGCYSENDINIFTDFCKKHKQFIFKPLNADCGKGVYKVEEQDLADHSSFFFEKMKNGPFIAEEIIMQHESMARLHLESINTVRIITLTYKKSVNVIAASIRIGAGNSVTDNAGSGGMFSSIDPLSGVVTCKATNYKKQTYIRHPDTQVIIPGFVIPQWISLLEIVNKVALEISDGNIPILISWDFALSTKGWVIVEINTGGDWIILQGAQKEGLKRNFYRQIDKTNEER